MALQTPYYLIYESRLLRNLKQIEKLQKKSGAKCVLALKCFSTWGVFNLISQYLDGTTSSSLFEAKLGHEKFGKEVHAYSVAFSDEEMRGVARFADKIIFNSISQMRRFQRVSGEMRKIPAVGLRVNPGVSHSHYDLANPARKHSRLGAVDTKDVEKVAGDISGLMFHFNCENDDLGSLSRNLAQIGRKYGALLKKMDWISLGGGIAFTGAAYPIEDLARLLRNFGEQFKVQVYLEPGEAVITGCAELVTTVLDVVHNEANIAVVDASVEAHMLDHLIYRTTPKIASPAPGPYEYIIAGRSCLAGDVFGKHGFKNRLRPGSVVRIADAAGYTMVKKNWFNGLPMPAICVKRLDGTVETLRAFQYRDFVRSLS